jgi:hypothetical protein
MQQILLGHRTLHSITVDTSVDLRQNTSCQAS